MPVPGLNRYNGGFPKKEGSYVVGFRRTDYRNMIDDSLPHLKITAKQLLTCGVVGTILICSGTVFALPYLVKFLQP